MGMLHNFNLKDLHTKHGVIRFMETGTGTGDSLEYAASAVFSGAHDGFKSLWSCEIEHEIARDAVRKFQQDPRVSIVNKSSIGFLAEYCVKLPESEPILFWLDAHFPGADYGFKTYGAEQDSGIRLPLEFELHTIIKNRPNAKDVIICDDARIYLDGPFRHGNLPANVRPYCPKARSLDFMHEIVGATHDIEVLYDHEGYVVMTPKPLEINENG